LRKDRFDISLAIITAKRDGYAGFAEAILAAVLMALTRHWHKLAK
jgi:hypothetical protein